MELLYNYERQFAMFLFLNLSSWWNYYIFVTTDNSYCLFHNLSSWWNYYRLCLTDKSKHIIFIICSGDGIIIDCGYQTTHIVPVLDGRMDEGNCRRMNFGGAHSDFFMQRLLQLKYPGHLSAISLSRAEVGVKFSI